MKSKNCVLVCVTPQSKCEQLIRSGSLIAQQYGVPLEVLSVFHERDGFSPDPAVLEDCSGFFIVILQKCRELTISLWALCILSLRY